MFNLIYFKGNENYGTIKQHNNINNYIKKLSKNLNLNLIEIESNLPKFKMLKELEKYNNSNNIFIGFSRGSKYFKKGIKGLKIGIGTKWGTYSFKNLEDKIIEGDFSEKSLNSHFYLSVSTKRQIEQIINNYINNNLDYRIGMEL